MKYDHYYMDIAVAVRGRAKCLGRHVGAILVKDDRVIATGFNGTPSGIKNCTEGGCKRCLDSSTQSGSHGKGYDVCICVHAEQNTLLMAARFGVSVQGSCLYTTIQPCFSCLKEVYQAGVVRVVYAQKWEVGHGMEEQYNLIADQLEFVHL